MKRPVRKPVRRPMKLMKRPIAFNRAYESEANMAASDRERG